MPIKISKHCLNQIMYMHMYMLKNLEFVGLNEFRQTVRGLQE